MKTFTLGLVALFLSLGACTNHQVTPPPSPPLNTTVRALPPLKVTWEEVSRTDTDAVVLATVERIIGLDMPFDVQVKLPPGVSVKSGRTSYALMPNVEAVTVQERLVLTYEQLPTEDAVLKLDGETGAMGYHYQVPYRFGRPPPQEHPPRADGPSVKLGDRNLGPSIPLP